MNLTVVNREGNLYQVKYDKAVDLGLSRTFFIFRKTEIRHFQNHSKKICKTFLEYNTKISFKMIRNLISFLWDLNNRKEDANFSLSSHDQISFWIWDFLHLLRKIVFKILFFPSFEYLIRTVVLNRVAATN